MQEHEIWRQAYNAALAGLCALPSSDGQGLNAEVIGSFARGAATRALDDFRACHSRREPFAADVPPVFWGKCEMKGFRSYLGRWRSVMRFGLEMIEVQEIQVDGTFGDCHLVDPRSIYDLHEMTEKRVREMVCPLGCAPTERPVASHTAETTASDAAE